jgi:hypothetical protein
MDRSSLETLLRDLVDGQVSVERAVERLAAAPSGELDFAHLDTHRLARTGHPEVIYGENKSAEQISAILKQLVEADQVAVVTRISAAKAEKVLEQIPNATWHTTARVLIHYPENHHHPTPIGHIAIVTAGTSDLPVAEEAAVVAEVFGNRVERYADVGVAGIHRVLHRLESLRQANVLIVVAGMEGALASVVAGMVSRPVIAVPTSVGYGASFGGLAALLGMLNSCAAGVSVVNIDNGFGAALQASLINRLGSGA